MTNGNKFLRFNHILILTLNTLMLIMDNPFNWTRLSLILGWTCVFIFHEQNMNLQKRLKKYEKCD